MKVVPDFGNHQFHVHNGVAKLTLPAPSAVP